MVPLKLVFAMGIEGMKDKVFLGCFPKFSDNGIGLLQLRADVSSPILAQNCGAV